MVVVFWQDSGMSAGQERALPAEVRVARAARGRRRSLMDMTRWRCCQDDEDRNLMMMREW